MTTQNNQRIGQFIASFVVVFLATISVALPMSAKADCYDQAECPVWGDVSYPTYEEDDWGDTYYPTYSNDDWGDTYYPSYNSPTYYEPTPVQWYEPDVITYNQPSTYYSSQPYNHNYQTDYSYNPGTYYSSQPYSGNYRNDYSYNPGTYDYSYDYYEYTYEYEYDYDACSNMPGNQSHGYDCDDDYDHCSNIPGDQPRGYDCVRDRDDDDEDVSCDLSASDTRVEEGDRVTLEWETDGNPNYASINQGIGRVDEDGGDERVEIDEDTTFRMTVRNRDGDEDTCSVTVRVDDENNFSSVTFVGEPTNNPPVVYLSDIPYTGLEDINPALLSYWLMLIAGAGAGMWFLYTKGMIPAFAFASAEPIEEEAAEGIAEGSGHLTADVENFLAALQSNDTASALEYVRDAAVNGTGIEEFLASAESATSDAELQSRVSAALAESRMTGIRGVKSVLVA